MLLHVRLLMEPFSAVGARVRSSVRVDQKMRAESAAAFETFAALLACEGLLLTVHCPVLAQTHRMSERLLADIAFERTLSGVRSESRERVKL